MNDNSFQEVLSAIRNFYARYRHPISVFEVHRLMKKMSSREVRNALVYLKGNNAIKFDYVSGMIEPILTDEETDFIGAKAVVIDEIKIRNCIKAFTIRNERPPTPMEIASTFISMYGIANVETLTRFVRKMGEDGKLERTDDFHYYLKNITSIGIRRFV